MNSVIIVIFYLICIPLFSFKTQSMKIYVISKVDCFFVVEKCSICTRCYDNHAYSHDNGRHGYSVISGCYSVYSAVPICHIRLPGMASLAAAIQKV